MASEPEIVASGPWEMRWVGPANEHGKRPTQPVRCDPKAVELLSLCGDGTADSPWDTDALVAFALHMRDAPAIVEDEIPESEPGRAE